MWPTIVLSLFFPCRNFCAGNFVIFFYEIKLLFTLPNFNVHFKSFKTFSVNFHNFTLFHIYLPAFQAYHPLCYSSQWLKEDMNCKKHQVLNYTTFFGCFCFNQEDFGEYIEQLSSIFLTCLCLFYECASLNVNHCYRLGALH